MASRLILVESHGHGQRPCRLERPALPRTSQPGRNPRHRHWPGPAGRPEKPQVSVSVEDQGDLRRNQGPAEELARVDRQWPAREDGRSLIEGGPGALLDIAGRTPPFGKTKMRRKTAHRQRKMCAS